MNSVILRERASARSMCRMRTISLCYVCVRDLAITRKIEMPSVCFRC